MHKLLIKSDDQTENSASRALGFFLDKDAVGFYEWHDWSAEKGLERLVFRLSKTPKYLQGHLERIYYCFQKQLDEQLYGALVDLLLVLNKSGDALSRRMIAGCKSRLTETQIQSLEKHLDSKHSGNPLLPFNRYSVFANGMLSTSAIVQIAGKDDQEHDPLSVARDYIEVSQLDEAITILEQAIMEQPERLELHDELLSLYRSTRDKSKFSRMYGALSDKQIILPPEWEQLKAFLGLGLIA